MRRLALVIILLLIGDRIALGQAGWDDPSPHKQRLIAVDPDAKIELLEWGAGRTGSGRTIVLLAQLGQTAHIYDDWAAMLASTYRVVGITRRGYGASSGAGGYSAEALASDILRVLDAENIRRPVLVGNGFAGEEMTWIAARMPTRIAGLIYLNAAYDRTNIAAETAIPRRVPRAAPPAPDDMASVAAFMRWSSNGSGLRIPESEFRQIAQLAPDGRVTGERTSPAIRQQVLAGMVKHDYSILRVPVLAIYSTPVSPDSYPGCQATTDPAARQACQEMYSWTLQQLDASKKLLRTIPGRTEILDIPGAHAFVFLSHPNEVMKAISPFIAGLPQ